MSKYRIKVSPGYPEPMYYVQEKTWPFWVDLNYVVHDVNHGLEIIKTLEQDLRHKVIIEQ